MVGGPGALAAPPGTTELRNQATLTTAELGSTLSDDPSVPGATDATVTPVNAPGGSDGGNDPEHPGPVVTGCTIADGATITQPTALSCSLNPVDGTTVRNWTVVATPADVPATESRTLASGTGAAPAATVDPTTMSNGLWNVTITAVGSDGGVTRSELTIVIDGQLKLGRYSVTYKDLEVPVAGLPVQVLRSYDSLDRLHNGDFGQGWSLDLADFKVQVNRPLGQGGWEQYECGVAVIVATYCVKSNRSHVVTVTWPDGRTKLFDLVPGMSPPGFSFLTPVTYRARGGAVTTKLEPAPDDQFAMYVEGGSTDGNLYVPLESEVYNPTRFTLVAKDGTRYLLDREDGLVSATDRSGNTVTVTPNGITTNAGVGITFTRDALDRITKVTGPDGRSLTYGYDGNGDLTAVTDQNAHATTHTYESGHWLTGTDTPAPGVFRTVTFDDDGRLATITDANGHTTAVDHTLAPGMRRETVVSPDGLTTTVSDFDERGNVVREDKVFADPAGDHHVSTWSYSTDGRDLITSRTDPTGRTWVTNPGGLLAGASTFTYRLDGAVNEIVRPNGVTARHGYDTAGRLDLLTHRTASGEVAKFAYGLDSNGNRSWQQWSLGGTTRTENYTFDELDRLTNANYGNGTTEAFTYDKSGNRTTTTATGGDTPGETTYSYDGAGRLTAVAAPAGSKAVGYDANGNVTSVGGDTYRYDANNNLTGATIGGQARDYRFNADDIRVNADGKVQLWDTEAGLPTLVNDGTATNTHGPTGVLASSTSAGSSYQLGDALGSIRGVTDASGSLTASSNYTAWGTPTGTVGNVGTFGYTGEQTDPGGNVHLRARSYNPALGRFHQQDTLQPNASGTQGWNHYTYGAGTNPVTATDPTGHMMIERLGLSRIAAIGLRPLVPGLAGVELGPLVHIGVAALAYVIAARLLQLLLDAVTDESVDNGDCRKGSPLSWRQKGPFGEALSLQKWTGLGWTLKGSQVTVRDLSTKMTTRVDFLFEKNSQRMFVEAKCGPSAGLSPNQRAIYPKIRAGGLTCAAGSNALAAGLPLCPTMLPPIPVSEDYW